MTEPRLDDLIDHRESIDGLATVETAFGIFQQHAHEFVAVTAASGRFLGLCSRTQVAGLLGGRYGFALHHRSPIQDHLLPDCICFERHAPLREVLDRALRRTGEDFYADVALVDHAGDFVGLISTEKLVHQQSRLMAEQFEQLAAQHVALERANDGLSAALAQQRELERQIIQKEKSELVQTLAGGVAHEINNKLVPVIGFAELLIAEVADLRNPRLGEYCLTIRDSAFEAARIIRQLLQLSKPTPPEKSSCDLRAIVEQGLTLVGLRLKEAGVSLDVRLPGEPVPVIADSAQLKQVLVNLVLNAVDAMNGASRQELQILLTVRGEDAVLSIGDSGAGIDPRHASRVFDPFFTTKGPTGGTGLGLSVCMSIVRQHDGDIAIESAVGTGTIVTVVLPVNRRAIAGDAVRAARSVARPARQRLGVPVLVVDDQESAARFVEQALRTLGCFVERVSDGHQAISFLQDRDVALVVSDIRMPRVNGAELLEWIRRDRPNLLDRTIFITGDATDSPLNADIRAAGVPVLQKPFSVQALLDLARAILEHGAVGHRA